MSNFKITRNREKEQILKFAQTSSKATLAALYLNEQITDDEYFDFLTKGAKHEPGDTTKRG